MEILKTNLNDEFIRFSEDFQEKSELVSKQSTRLAVVQANKK